jgi:hypothetical protein
MIRERGKNYITLPTDSKGKSSPSMGRLIVVNSIGTAQMEREREREREIAIVERYGK